jgi:hypothetical protein
MRTFRETLVVHALSPAARTDGTANGTGIDRSPGNRYGSVVFAITTGVLTDGIHTFKIQDADADTGYADAAAGDVDGTASVTAITNDNVAFSFAYKGSKRWVRLVCTTSGATTGGILGAVAVLGNPHVYPTQ